jgi:hypothetical protein
MTLYTIKDRQIYFADGKVVDFDHSIAEVVEFDDVLVVRLKIPPKIVYNENVFGLDFRGEILWKVEPIKHVTEDSSYVGIKKRGERSDTVFLYNWDGKRLEVDSRTGNVIGRDWLK